MKTRSERTASLSSSATEPENDAAFIERLRSIVAIAGSASALARNAGISQGGLQRYLKGGEPTRRVLISLAKAAGVNLGWLMTGEGSQKSEEREATGSDQYVYVPLYDARVSAGHGSWSEGAHVITQLAFTRYSLSKKGLEPTRMSAVRVGGDSMEPLLSDGDAVVIDHDLRTVRDEAIYVIRVGDQLYAKRLQRQFDGSIAIISENKAYKDMVVPKDQLSDLDIIGRVVWLGRWMV
ncbi:XRE family transcriptional regulator [Pseudomonas aeruginosa]